MTQEILRKALELVDGGQRIAMATVVVAKGSVPGKSGARLFVTESGAVHGTVGGAGLEERVKAACRAALESGRGAIHHFDLQFYKEGGLDSLCGGSVDIVTEILQPRPHILICGGGHVGLEVAKLLDQVEYSYSILDDRPEYASNDRFPRARDRFALKPAEFFEGRDLTPFTHMLLLGYSHRIDTEILFHAATRYDRWIGIIASRAKRKEMLHRVKARGITETQLSRVEMPVGLPIGAETPAEIAVSIVASILKQWKGADAVAPQPAVEIPSGHP